MRGLSRVLVGLLAAGAGVWVLRARRQTVRTTVVEYVFERPVRERRYAELADELHVAGERVALRLERARRPEATRELARHIIGIERWGQSRLRVALGEPFVRDEHHPYKPATDASWSELLAAFRDTRSETVAIARALSDTPPDVTWRVEHNGLGPMSARGWLRYLQLHADLESRRLT